jgi:drug/metabolite transporter (DMT)-like permease
MLMTNYSLTLISYPAQVMIKSCKLIPAMFGAYWVRGMQYNKYQYLSAALITFGMILFNLEGKNHQNSNLFKGILACATSLILGGFTSYFIEKLRSEYNPTSLSIQQFCSASGVFFILPFVLGKNFITSQQSILEYSLKYPDVILEIVIYGVVGAIGNSFIFWGLKCYGSLNVIIITTTRKALTVIISILWYSHNFTSSRFF